MRFGTGSVDSIGSTIVQTPNGEVVCHIVPCNTQFLLCLHDTNYLETQFLKLAYILIQGTNMVLLIRKWRHPWMLLARSKTIVYSYVNELENITECHLAEGEIRQLHRRFGYPSAHRPMKALRRSGHDVDSRTVKQLTKYHQFFQKCRKPSERFKFTLHDDTQFNQSIHVDVIYILGQPTLHVFDESTRFQAAR